MKTLFYSTKDFECPFIAAANHESLDLQFTPVSLSLNTIDQAEGCEAICIFTTDTASAATQEALQRIAETTIYNLQCFQAEDISKNQLTRDLQSSLNKVEPTYMLF